MSRIYKLKKTISINQFISELGESFSDKVKKRLLDVDEVSVLTRNEDSNSFDLKHVEHTKHESMDIDGLKAKNKEYCYGCFLVNEGVLYYTDACTKNDQVEVHPIAKEICASLKGSDINKVIDDENIDYVIDALLNVCPKVSKKYLDIVNGMISRAQR